MRKLTVLQWIALISAFVGLLMESNLLGDSEIVNEVLGKILIAFGMFKTTYDLYMSFNAENVADYHNDNIGVNASAKQSLSTKKDVLNWSKNQ